jgi:hypothetical protein
LKIHLWGHETHVWKKNRPKYLGHGLCLLDSCLQFLHPPKLFGGLPTTMVLLPYPKDGDAT